MRNTMLGCIDHVLLVYISMMINTAKFTERLTQLVATPSISCTQADLDMSNKPVIELLAGWLDDLGFATKITPVPEHAGKVNLVATLGQGSGGLILAGHSDTVPCNPERWQQDPFKLKEKSERFYGLGATDMKGFFPVVLAAIEALKGSLNKLQSPLIVLATADEESSMSGARALAKAGFPQARYAVIGEPTNMKPIRMHKGIVMEKVRVQGKAGHSSNPELGYSALETMHQVLGELIGFRKELQSEYQHAGFEINVPTLNLGCIHGGDNPNRICGHCELEFDLRPLPGMSIDALHESLSRRLIPLGEARNTPLFLSRLFSGVEAFEEPAESELVAIVEKLTGHSSESVAFATEAPFLKSLGMETVVMGPGSIDQAHQPDEFIEHAQIQPAVNIIKQLIQQCCFNLK